MTGSTKAKVQIPVSICHTFGPLIDGLEWIQDNSWAALPGMIVALMYPWLLVLSSIPLAVLGLALVKPLPSVSDELEEHGRRDRMHRLSHRLKFLGEWVERLIDRIQFLHVVVTSEYRLIIIPSISLGWLALSYILSM